MAYERDVLNKFQHKHLSTSGHCDTQYQGGSDLPSGPPKRGRASLCCSQLLKVHSVKMDLPPLESICSESQGQLGLI